MSRRFTILRFGFSLSLLVDILSSYSGTAFFGLPSFAAAADTLYLLLNMSARIVVFLIVAFVTGRTAHTLNTTPFRRGCTVIVCTLLSLAGIALIAISSATQAIALLVCGTLVFGAAQGLLGILWLLTLVSFDYRGSYLFIFLNHAVATVLGAVLLLAPLIWLLPAATVCLIVSSVGLFFAPRMDTVEQSIRSQLGFLAPRLGGWILMVGLFALASGFMLSVSDTLAADVDPATFLYASLGNSGFILIIMLLPAVVFKRPLQIETSYRIALPLAALGFLVLPGLTDLIPPYFAGTLTMSGYMVTGIIIYCSIAEIVRITKVPPLPLFALAEALTLIPHLAGKVIGLLYVPNMQTFNLEPALLGIGGLYLITLGVSWLFTHDWGRISLASLLRRNPAVRAEAGQAHGSVDTERLGEEGGPRGAEGRPAQHAQPGQLPARPLLSLDEVADRLDLRDQGRTIFMQLMEGRTLPRIADDLFLSTSSIKYHTQKMYRALNVHSRGELFDAVERIRRGEG